MYTFILTYSYHLTCLDSSQEIPSRLQEDKMEKHRKWRTSNTARKFKFGVNLYFCIFKTYKPKIRPSMRNFSHPNYSPFFDFFVRPPRHFILLIKKFYATPPDSPLWFGKKFLINTDTCVCTLPQPPLTDL